MAKNSLADVKRDATEKYCEEEDPFEVVNQSGQEILFIIADSENCQSEIANTVEDDNDGNVDLERIDVVVVQVAVVPSNEDVVSQRQDPS